jgi:hypothetical protein
MTKYLKEKLDILSGFVKKISTSLFVRAHAQQLIIGSLARHTQEGMGVTRETT